MYALEKVLFNLTECIPQGIFIFAAVVGNVGDAITSMNESKTTYQKRWVFVILEGGASLLTSHSNILVLTAWNLASYICDFYLLCSENFPKIEDLMSIY